MFHFFYDYFYVYPWKGSADPAGRVRVGICLDTVSFKPIANTFFYKVGSELCVTGVVLADFNVFSRIIYHLSLCFSVESQLQSSKCKSLTPSFVLCCPVKKNTSSEPQADEYKSLVSAAFILTVANAFFTINFKTAPSVWISVIRLYSDGLRKAEKWLDVQAEDSSSIIIWRLEKQGGGLLAIRTDDSLFKMTWMKDCYSSSSILARLPFSDSLQCAPFTLSSKSNRIKEAVLSGRVKDRSERRGKKLNLSSKLLH